MPLSKPVHAGAQNVFARPVLTRDANLCVRLSKKLIFVETGYDVSTLSCGFVNTSVDITGFLVNLVSTEPVHAGAQNVASELSEPVLTKRLNLYATFIKS